MVELTHSCMHLQPLVNCFERMTACYSSLHMRARTHTHTHLCLSTLLLACCTSGCKHTHKKPWLQCFSQLLVLRCIRASREEPLSPCLGGYPQTCSNQATGYYVLWTISRHMLTVRPVPLSPQVVARFLEAQLHLGQVGLQEACWLWGLLHCTCLYAAPSVAPEAGHLLPHMAHSAGPSGRPSIQLSKLLIIFLARPWG